MNDDIVETGDICTCSRYVSAQMRMIKYFYNDSSPNAEFALSRIPPDHSFGETLLKNKRFLLQFWPHQNLLYLIYIWKPQSSFFILRYFICFPYECPGLYRHRPGHSLERKINSHEMKKQIWVFVYIKYSKFWSVLLGQKL